MSRTANTPLARIAAAEAAALTPGGSANLITDFYRTLNEVAASFDAGSTVRPQPGVVTPGFALPELTPQVAEFFGAAEARWLDFGSYRDQSLTLLNLAANPGTNTTKTFPSLLIVARAVEHIRRHGEPVIIFTPTSANKGTALRDAVQRALACGLATPEQLRVVVLAPASSAGKLRAGALSEDPALAALNPVLTLRSPVAEEVKALGREFVAEHAEEVHRRTGARVWFSLDLNNYLLADVSRALFEHATAPLDQALRPRTHAHAVSSAFGMLGYHRGRSLLEEAGISSPARRPHTLLVQHLGTPDMVLDLRFGSFDRSHVPQYRADPAGGRHHQQLDPHFPATTDDPAEILDSTFYTHAPVTAATMTGIINTYGGDGIVVSGHECRERYPELRAGLEGAGFSAPADPAGVREWSLVMALTGVLNAIDRGLVKPDHDVVVHGSGWYTDADYTPLGPGARPVASAADIARIVCGESPADPA
ncbi:DUF6002 family protein [Kitasatospora sp. NPDC056138]|uniref:DUF6002 family protein n=1 Tax=Kitasatospora sp. NPDC056138 TaxID=3345724 RepID=UPI0035D62709